MDKLAELLRQGADKLVNLPTQAQRFVTNPQAFVQLLTGKNALPRETGFAAGATGLPPEQGTVLDPSYQAYMQGYQQGEPVSFAAMAAPAAIPVAKALAPKAGQMAEQYMVNQGFMPSLIAYHGTPHTIKGKFDISKVGTGEGAQAYGHGMYFAESPEVSKTYMRTQINNAPELERMAKNAGVSDDAANTVAQWYFNTKDKTKINDFFNAMSQKSPSENINKFREKVLLEKPQIEKAWQEFTKSGNLYKVDIPDEAIPNMLNWDEKVPEDVRKRISKLTMEQFGNGATGTSGEHLYKEIVFEMRRNGSKTPESDASKWLAQNGVTGIVYKDAGSRGIKGGTSNYVVFDPSEVQILEKNSKPMTRKEIIEQELEKVSK